ncbi:hypothetical protein ACIRVF_08255 [Kitasatospora sp. NPDC101157]|uniref:hypothetical protein n=1 Tax=Kitasatospora sp. NPDC101157 TaxID=3364098 RepID=UPI003808431B
MTAGNKPICGAKTRQEESAEYCGLRAGWGTSHPGTGRCRLHGGNTPGQKVRAAQDIAEQEVRAVLAELDVQPVDDPLTALMQLAGQVVAWQTATATLVNRIGDEIRYEGGAGAEQLRAEVQLYERAMDRANAVLSSIARLNIEERLATISEAQAERILGAIDAVLAHLGVTGVQAAEAKTIAARHLRSV